MDAVRIGLQVVLVLSSLILTLFILLHKGKGGGLVGAEIGGLAEFDHRGCEANDVLGLDPELPGSLSYGRDLIMGGREGLREPAKRGLHLRRSTVNGLRDPGPRRLPVDRGLC